MFNCSVGCEYMHEFILGGFLALIVQLGVMTLEAGGIYYNMFIDGAFSICKAFGPSTLFSLRGSFLSLSLVNSPFLFCSACLSCALFPLSIGCTANSVSILKLSVEEWTHFWFAPASILKHLRTRLRTVTQP